MSAWPTYEQVQEYVERGLIKLSAHPTLPLVVACYTRTVQFERLWDEVTTAARGLVFNTETGEVVGAGYRKFFAVGDPIAVVPPYGEPYTAFDKVDGSLIHVGEFDGELLVWTKGSFTTEHSVQALEYLKSWRPSPGTTALFEGIFGSLNRVVVDYGQFRGLVLLGEVDVATGKDWKNPFDVAEDTGWPYEVVTERDGITVDFLTTLCADEENGPDREGFVIVYPRENAPAHRLKIKFVQYLKLHKLMTSLTTKRVRDTYIEAMETDYRDGGELGKALWDAFLDLIPDELDSAVQSVINQMISEAQDACAEAKCAGLAAALLPTRALAAAELSKLPSDVRSLAWFFYDGKEELAALTALKRVEIETEMLLQIEDDE